jgi:hypothetical protein
VQAHVGSDQLIYWRPHEPARCVAPDIYVLPGVSQEETIQSWKTWETNIIPSFVLEVVAMDPSKDYALAPRRYESLALMSC